MGGAGDYKTELGKWYHFAGTYDGKTVKFYVNGAPDAKSDVADIIYSNNVPFNIGRRSDGGSFAGTIDDVMIFSKALTEPEIKKIMVAGASPGTAVEASGKLATTWGSIKKR